MTPERWQQVKQVLATALELVPAERASYLAQIYASDPRLQAELEPLMDSGERLGDGFLGEDHLAAAAVNVLVDPAISEPEFSWIGRRVGAYKVVELIGEGGMGQVFRATRADDQFQQEVALKFVRAGQFGEAVFARFRNERQILADLDHPNLARLLDGGATEEGIPYLVMEFIEGEPITAWCAARNLSLRQRLQLFLQVCAAVHYAHRHLIIHRDIKPQNIFVTTDGTPKLLDFGIAKIVEADPADALPDLTLTGFRALTPRYASPEQMKGEAMTTATDVYSLGVVLYELITGLSPYETANVSTSEQIRIVCEKEITRPSLAVARPLPASGMRAFPELSSDKLRRQLAGDLDNIVLMALRKEPSRRYASVNDFQEDIRRYLENLPVIARNDTVRYRAGKFVARHKAGVAATAAVALILIAGIVITLREARIARQRFDDVRSLANSLIFDVHDSVKDLPGSTPARKIIVDRALRYLNGLAEDSAGDIGLERELATAYEKVGSVQGDYLENNLGDSEGTLVSYKKALELRKQIASSSRDWNDRLALAQGYRLVAHQLSANGDAHTAREIIPHAIEVSDALNQERPNNAMILHELGFDYEVSGAIGYPGDTASNQKVIEDYRRGLVIGEIEIKLNPNDIQTLHGYSTGLSDVAKMLEPSDPRAALDDYGKCLEIDRRLSQLTTNVHFTRAVAIDYGSIAGVFELLGDYPHAVENNLKDLAIYKELVASDPRNVLLRRGFAITYMNTASASSRAGQSARALDFSVRALDIMRSIAASAPPVSFEQRVYAIMLVIHGEILTAANQPEAARAEIEHGRSLYEALYKAGNMSQVYVAAADVKLGEAMTEQGRDRDAASAFHVALAIVEPVLPGAPPDLNAIYTAADAYSDLGGLSIMAAKRPGLPAARRKAAWTEARSWLQQSQDAWRRIDHPNHTAPDNLMVGDPAVVAMKLRRIDAALSPAH